MSKKTLGGQKDRRSKKIPRNTSESGIKCVCLNAMSIMNKKTELHSMVDDIKPHIIGTRRVPVQRAALCIRNFPSQYSTHFRGLSGHNAGRFNATVFISMLSGSELAFPLIARQPLTRLC